MPFIVTAVTAIAGAISGVLAAGGIGAALLRIGGTLLLSYAAQALMPKPQTTMQPRTVTIREPVVPRDLVYGRTRKGGVIVFLHSSGSDNKFLDLVIVLATHRVKSIGAIYFEGEVAVNAAGTAQGRWAGKVAVEKKLGAANQTAFAGLKSALPDKWTENHRLRGCAAIRLRLTYDQDAFPSGIPNITVDIEGKDDIWDPRTQTAGYSENPALCLADYMANGSLLSRKKLDFIAEHDIEITISHDGPGQHLRGPDPFDDPNKNHWIQTLLAERPEKTGFNAVLTRQHHDLRALKAWFAEKVGPDIFVGLEGVVNVYDAATAIGTGRFEPAELNSLTRSIFEALVEDPNAFGLGERIDEFFASIQRRRPIEALSQKCGMDSPDAIAVDLRGNVMTCQNTGAKGVHKIGHVADFDAIALDTATHFAFREECMSCPVVQLCKGSCMFLEGEFFKQSCANEFAFNMGIMMAAVWHLTGMVVVGVEALCIRAEPSYRSVV